MKGQFHKEAMFTICAEDVYASLNFKVISPIRGKIHTPQSLDTGSCHELSLLDQD